MGYMRLKRGTFLIVVPIVLFIVISGFCTLSFAVATAPYKILMLLWQGETSAEKGFREALSSEFPDQNIEYIVQDACKSSDKVRELIDSADETHYSLIYTYGSTIAAKAAKNFKNTPLLFNIVLDPIGYKIIESWDKKQPNLTGASIAIPINLLIQKMHDLFGKGDIGLIYNPLDKNSVEMKEEMEACVLKAGAELRAFEFRENFNSLNAYLDNVRGRVKCIYLPTEYLVVGYIERILSDINRAKFPTCVTSKTYLTKGALVCITAEYYDVGKMAGKLASQILKGTKPGAIPIQRPTGENLTIYVNSASLKKLNMEIPKDIEVKYFK